MLARFYAGLVKQVVLGTDGVLRAQWWSANDVLKAGPLTPTGSGGKQTTECVGSCVSSGLWLEGSITPAAQPSGVWLELNGTAGGFGFAIDKSGNFTLGQMSSPTAQMQKPLVIDRAMALSGDATFKLLVRNSWSNLGLSEFYVNDVLSLPFTLPAALTGSFATIGGGKVASVNKLSLPEA